MGTHSHRLSRRNRFARLSHNSPPASQKRVRARALGPQKQVRDVPRMPECVPFDCQSDAYPFLRNLTQKQVRKLTQKPLGSTRTQKRVRFRADCPCAQMLERPRGMARAGTRRFGHHAHPARWPGAWLARSPSFHSHEQYFDPRARGRRNLANSNVAPWWACIGGTRSDTGPASDGTS